VMTIFQKLLLISTASFFGIFLPLLSFYFLKKSGNISTFYMDESYERNIPYIIMVFCYSIGTVVIQKIPMITPIFLVVFINSAILVIIVLITNTFTKVSAHLASLGSLVAYLYMFAYLLQMDLLKWIFATLFVAGLVSTARISLNAHTKLQVYLGFFIGIIITSLVLIMIFRGR
jgi:hypothetical protein